MPIHLYITGTDTNVGKTFVSLRILDFYNKLGFSTIALKPIATGCAPKNEDALLLQEKASIKLPYETINPIAYFPPIAPNIAAQLVNETLSIASLNDCTKDVLQQSADVILIEGAGGTHVPLNKSETFANWAAEKKFKVILVVGLRLGCINHAILSLRALLADQCEVVGWIGNHIDPDMLHMQENIATLKECLSVPCLGIVPHTPVIPETAAGGCPGPIFPLNNND